MPCTRASSPWAARWSLSYCPRISLEGSKEKALGAGLACRSIRRRDSSTPETQGALTFELQNVGRVPIPLYPGMRVAQICFFECERSSIPYGGKARSSYGGHPGLISSRYYEPIDAEILRRIHPPKEAPEKILTDIKALIAKNLGQEAAKPVITALERAASERLNSGAFRRG